MFIQIHTYSSKTWCAGPISRDNSSYFIHKNHEIIVEYKIFYFEGRESLAQIKKCNGFDGIYGPQVCLKIHPHLAFSNNQTLSLKIGKTPCYGRDTSSIHLQEHALENFEY